MFASSWAGWRQVAARALQRYAAEAGSKKDIAIARIRRHREGFLKEIERVLREDVERGIQRCSPREADVDHML